MPYYIYKIKPFNILEKITSFNTFKEAAYDAKIRRQQEDANSPDKIKVIFADSELHAEDLLTQVRTAGPKGDD